MDSTSFNISLDDVIARVCSLLGSEGAEYAGDEDRLHNFRAAAALRGITMHEALGGMMLKHTVSIYDMIDGVGEGKYYPLEVWDEKIIDHINYLILLRAIVKYEAQLLSVQPVRSVQETLEFVNPQDPMDIELSDQCLEACRSLAREHALTAAMQRHPSNYARSADV